MNELYLLLYGDDGATGIIGEIRNGGFVDQEAWEKVKEHLRTLVATTKKDPEFPSTEMATICDMLLDLSANCDEVEDVVDCISDATLILQEWHNV